MVRVLKAHYRDNFGVDQTTERDMFGFLSMYSCTAIIIFIDIKFDVIFWMTLAFLLLLFRFHLYHIIFCYQFSVPSRMAIHIWVPGYVHISARRGGALLSRLSIARYILSQYCFADTGFRVPYVWAIGNLRPGLWIDESCRTRFPFHRLFAFSADF